jgi:hypothetical protein
MLLHCELRKTRSRLKVGCRQEWPPYKTAVEKLGRRRRLKPSLQAEAYATRTGVDILERREDAG